MVNNHLLEDKELFNAIYNTIFKVDQFINFGNNKIIIFISSFS
jgi:hypothetical protein